MKKIYLFLLLVAVCFGAHAQNAQNPCNSNYKTEISRIGHEQYAVSMDWDFTSIRNVSSATIEVMPIRDCWNEINGTQLGTLKTITVTANLKGSQALTVNDMIAKCFKWRVVVVSPDCTFTTDWKYYSFLPKK